MTRIQLKSESRLKTSLVIRSMMEKRIMYACCDSWTNHRRLNLNDRLCRLLNKIVFNLKIISLYLYEIQRVMIN